MSDAEKRAKEWEAANDECNKTPRGELRKALELFEGIVFKIEHGEMTGGDEVRMHRALIKLRWSIRRVFN